MPRQLCHWILRHDLLCFIEKIPQATFIGTVIFGYNKNFAPGTTPLFAQQNCFSEVIRSRIFFIYRAKI